MKQSSEATRAGRLARAGWRTTTIQDFLNLSDEDVAIIEVKVALAKRLREQRTRAGLSQVEVARVVRSSQPRVAKMEAADRSVSIDLLVRALVKTGVSVRDIGRSLEVAGSPTRHRQPLAVREEIAVYAAKSAGAAHDLNSSLARTAVQHLMDEKPGKRAARKTRGR